MRIAVDREIAEAARAFDRFGDVTLFAGRELTRADVANVDVLVVRSVTRVDAALLDGTAVSRVASATAGIDHVDTAYLARRGIEFFHAPGCNARAVAEYVLACALIAGPLRDRAPESLSIGIIGCGHVGREVAAIFGTLGVRAVMNDPPLAETTDFDSAPLDAALACDIVTLHVPLTASGRHPTQGLIGAAALERIPPGAMLVNAARGGVVDEPAAVASARAGRHTLVVDCWSGEPRIDTATLRAAAIATPHIAGHTREARLRATTQLVSQLGDGSETPTLAPEPPTRLTVAAADPEAVVRTAVLAACDPRRPSDALAATAPLPAEARAGAFDQQRRDAAGRREFSGHRVASAALQSDTVACLRGLGFELFHGDPS